jgi:hypothetical protein
MAGDELKAFAQLVDALRPWGNQIVIVGGWAHRLHRAHEWAGNPKYAPLLTKDADLAISRAQALQGDMRTALQNAGFEEVLIGDHRPPIAEYRLGDASDGFFAEFLVPLVGSGVKRSGATDATAVSGGVTAQKLRHLDLLLVRPWSVQLDAAAGFLVANPVEVLVANPVTFIAQKLLIRGKRAPKKQAQDVLYMHDTLELFGSRLDELRAIWLDEVKPALMPKTATIVERLQEEQYREVDDVIRDAALIPVDRSLTPAQIRDDCAYGLQAIFADFK